MVENFLNSHPEVSHGDLLVVGVSGGPDSMSLAHILSKLNYQTIAAHLNHQIREESDVEAGYVRDFSESVGIKFRTKDVNVVAVAEEQGLSLEEAAREQRYKFLFEIAESEGAKAVLVGHTADDQVETVLMHLLRGAGLPGLKGMQPTTHLKQYSSDIPLLRPLLTEGRQDVLDYCSENDLEPLFDRSNLDKTIFRNRIRHELIPNLESYNPKIRQGILRMAGILSEDNQVIREAVSEKWEACVREMDSGAVRFDLVKFREQSLGLRRGLIRRAVGYLRPHLKDIDFHMIEKAVTFVNNPTQSRESDLAADLRIVLDGDSFWIAPWDSQLEHLELPNWDKGKKEIKLPGSQIIGSGWVFNATKLKNSKELYTEALGNTDSYSAWLDGETIGDTVIVRTRKEGDRFQPLGLGKKSVKLADFCINVKMPRLARDSWPLICRQDEVIWIPGYRQSDSSKLTPDSKTVFKFQLKKIIA